jgi:hypothetical protein
MVDSKLDKLMDIVNVSGCTIMSDGWSSVQRRPLINYLLATPKGIKFLRAVDTSGTTKNAEYLADEFCKIIDEVKAQNVVCLITDSASVNEAAAKKVNTQHPHIFWVRCAAHALNLVLQDIGKLNWVQPVWMDAKSIVRFIRNHHKSLALLRKYSADGKQKELLMPGADVHAL